MRIRLAGFNVDADELGRAAGHVDPHVTGAPVFTPETISAAYARISRDPRAVDELRAAALQDVAKARASNEQIVFGYGHASVAEHAVFNFDIMGVSRLAIEAIEHARLCSYTEKSQRYTRLGREFVVPREIAEAGLEAEFRGMVAIQHAAYERLLSGIVAHLLAQSPDATKEERRAIEGRAKEDARYATCLAVEGQLGMTCNARSLGYMVRRLSANPLHEVRDIGTLLRDQAGSVAPSLLRHAEPAQAQSDAMRELRALALEIVGASAPCESADCAKLLDWDPDADNLVLAALLHSHAGKGLEACERLCGQMGREQASRGFKAVFGGLQAWDAPPRAFELARFRFELVVSASCFAQLKRHRMATLLPQAYEPALGHIVPPLIREAGLEHILGQALLAATGMHAELVRRGLPFAAPYALTQAHRRRVIVEMDARELYHFSRLRQDSHAQWDIRAIADRMVAQAKQACPLTMALACGKDEFARLKADIVGRACGS